MKLQNLIPALMPIKAEGAFSAEVRGLAYDARRVGPGDVYFALQRGSSDGDREIEQAVGRGAIAVVSRPRGAVRHRAARIEVADTRAASARAAAVFYGKPAEKLRIIGVHGTDAWKTVFLLKSILEKNGISAGVISSLQHEIRERILPAGLYPEPVDVQHLLAEMVRAGCSACIMELGELSSEALTAIPLDLLVLGGGGQKPRAVSDYMNDGGAGKPSCAVINIDDQAGQDLANSVLFDGLITCGFASGAQVRVEEMKFSVQSSLGRMFVNEESFLFEAALIGRDNVRHLAAACAAAVVLDIGAPDIAGALIEIQTAPGSLEPVPHRGDFHVFVDAAHDEKSLESVLRCVREIAPRRILLAFGATEKTAGAQRFKMGEIAARCTDHVILTSDNAGREGVEQICSALAQGLENAGSTRYHFQPDRELAIGELIAMAGEGDVLLISGKGARAYQELASTIVPFDDRVIAAGRLARVTRARPRNKQPLLVTA